MDLKKKLSCLVPVVMLLLPAGAQEKTWTLQDCLDYAMEHNISLQRSRNAYASGLEDTQQARAALSPSLSASTSQGVSTAPFAGDGTSSYNGSYGLNGDVTLYSGGKLRRSVQAQEVQNERDSLSVEGNALDIRISILQAYMQCLYAAESVTVSESTLEASRAQRDRAEQMWKAGSISKVDFAQLESQLYSDEYQLTSARTRLESYRLALKQLLELDINDDLVLSGADASDAEVLRVLPSKAEVYDRALAYLPEIASSYLAVTSAEIAERQAKAGYSPSVGLSAGIGTSSRSGTGNAYTRQLSDGLSANAGLTLSIPILDGRRNKTAVNKARIALADSKLEVLSTQKAVLRDVETAYLDAVSSQAEYTAAAQKEKYALQSYELTDEQFRVGMKNTVELITAKNELLSARLSRLQSKYMALLNLQLLDIYQGLES